MWFPGRTRPGETGSSKHDPRTVTLRKFVFTALIVLFALAIWYGIAAGDFLETISNGVTICLTCIGVA